MTAQLVPVAEEIASWCDRQKHADLPAWRAIAALLRDGTVQTELQWQDLVAAAEGAMERRKGAAKARPDDPRLDARFGDAWAIRRAIQRNAWRQGHGLAAAA